MIGTTLTRITIPDVVNSAAVAEITHELKAVPHANRLTIRLDDQGVGIVSILSNHELDDADLTAAILRAGFTVSSIETIDDALATQMKLQAPGRQASRNAAVALSHHPET